MTPAPEHLALEIARDAAGVSGAARAAVLERRCGGDAALRARVEALLMNLESRTIVGGGSTSAASGAGVTIAGVHESATIPPDRRATEAPSATIVEAPGMSAGTPRRIGAYAIRGVLGEGGMGVVYLAEQERPRRTVALKVIRTGLLTPRLLRRFEHESQILARLQHPGIAQVYEAGQYQVEGGSAAPFFAMEFVRGEPLTGYAAARRLSVAARIDLFVRVCDAVQHAHVKGVVHRDLKPANILVAEEAEGEATTSGSRGGPRVAVKVLDFGVARATDADVGGAGGAAGATMATAPGQVIGTVPYMSPEQIAGNPDEVDARSDVYTLGVILYEILAGRLPHRVEGKTLVEAARTIGEEEPAPLGSIDRGLRGDLQTIVATALAKDRSRRYQSAGELAADLGRYLRDEPILARPPGSVYLLRKFARRNRGLVAGASAAVVILIAGTIGTAWQAVEATRGRELADLRRAEAEAARAMAAEEADNARAMSDFLSNMLASIDPELAQGREVTVREVLDRAGRDVAGAFEERPRIAASLHATIARTYQSLARLEEAEAGARAALDLLTRAAGPDAPETIEATRALANILADRGKLEEAGTLATRALERTIAAKGERSIEAGVAMGDVARVLLETGKLDEGERMFREGAALVEAAAGTDDPRALTLRHNLAIAVKDRGRFAEAVEIMTPVLEARRRLLGDDHPATLASLNSLAANLQKAGDSARAAELLRAALLSRRRVLGDEHPGTLTSAINLGVTLVGLGDLDGAEPLFREALAGLERSLGIEHSRTQIALNSLAYVAEERGDLVEAERLYRRCVEVRRRIGGDRDQETWGPMNNLATLLQRVGRLDEAEAMFRELLAGCRAALPEGHYYIAIFQSNYADCLTAMGRLDEADAVLGEAIPVLEATLGPQHARTVKARARQAALAAARRPAAGREEPPPR